jgi:L-amino acid N-acyltransferase YncA
MLTHTLRSARAADLAAISDIYNHYVARSTCTFALQPETLDERKAWFAGRGQIHPVLVTEEAGAVIGWASLSPWNKRCAYAQTVESSVYIHHDHHRRGLGKALMVEMLQMAVELKLHSLIAGVSADQPASLRVHQRLGFSEVARFKEVGFKFGKWLDVIYLQKMIAD